MKICFKCKEDLPLSSFGVKSANKDGLNNKCKGCIKILSRIYYESNTEACRQRTKRRLLINPEINKNYYRDNLEYFKKYNDNCSEKRKQWQISNKERIKEQRRILWEKKPELKIKATLRSYFWRQLKKSRIRKSNSSIKLLGCSIQEFKIRLGSMFSEGMTWDNYGQWHLDHIKPCASFDLSDPNQLSECFHYTNFQPLWAKDNLEKGSKY